MAQSALRPRIGDFPPIFGARKLAFALLVIVATVSVPCFTHARPPAGYEIPKSTVSPDGRFGILVPDQETYDGLKEQNSLVEIKTGRSLGVIHAETGVTFGHKSIFAKWSPDSSRVFWSVDGKWGSMALVVVDLRDGQIAKQTNFLPAIHKEIIARTKAALPKEFGKAVVSNRGTKGSAYPEGFTVDVLCQLPANLENIRFSAALTSDPKEAMPPELLLESYLEGEWAPGSGVQVNAFYAYRSSEIASFQSKGEQIRKDLEATYQKLLAGAPAALRKQIEATQNPANLAQSRPESFAFNFGSEIWEADKLRKRIAELKAKPEPAKTAPTATTDAAPTGIPSLADFAALRKEINAKAETTGWKAVTKNLPSADKAHRHYVKGWLEGNVLQFLMHVDSHGEKDESHTFYYWREGQLVSVFQIRKGAATRISGVEECTETYNFVGGKMIAWKHLPGSGDGLLSPNTQGFADASKRVTAEALKYSQPIYDAIGAD